MRTFSTFSLPGLVVLLLSCIANLGAADITSEDTALALSNAAVEALYLSNIVTAVVSGSTVWGSRTAIVLGELPLYVDAMTSHLHGAIDGFTEFKQATPNCSIAINHGYSTYISSSVSALRGLSQIACAADWSLRSHSRMIASLEQLGAALQEFVEDFVEHCEDDQPRIDDYGRHVFNLIEETFGEMRRCEELERPADALVRQDS